ncbi:MAG TPA: CDP-alcohol phosphatidyltransferase family protein [Candidatus Bathyarchaeota archaeon]|nr:CDP-alcohol phosphatidyltransferase family protein [Candidatus Bathyarchaeota archaeon]
MGLEEKMVKKKGPSDFVARYIHQPIENWAVSRLVHTSITPNQVTLATNLLAYLTTFLYLRGEIAAGLAVALVVGVLDGIDGKLARAKEMASKVGKLEHAFDLLYEFSWLAALGLYYTQATGKTAPLTAALLSMLFISFYRMVYDVFGRVTGVSLDIYSPVERVARRVLGRRNLYNLHILAGLALGSWRFLETITAHAALTAIFYTWRAWRHLSQLDRDMHQNH